MLSPDQLYSRGSNVVLLCVVQGGPRNSIQWLLNKEVLSEELISSNVSMLTLLNVTGADGGMYTCNVTNRAGTSNATTSVFISPYFTSRPQNVGGVNGSMVTLTCMAEAFPEPEYQWLRADGETIREAIMGENSAILLLSPLMFGDEGLYFCRVTSGGRIIDSNNATLSGKSDTLYEP